MNNLVRCDEHAINEQRFHNLRPGGNRVEGDGIRTSEAAFDGTWHSRYDTQWNWFPVDWILISDPTSRTEAVLSVNGMDTATVPLQMVTILKGEYQRQPPKRNMDRALTYLVCLLESQSLSACLEWSLLVLLYFWQSRTFSIGATKTLK